MKDATWLSAAEAAKRLGVNVSTLYAYVSRGFIRSEPAAGKSRARRYRREDVERLRRRNEERRDPGKAAQRALHWGVPVLESSIALIANGRLYYRGHDVAELARTRTVEEVASLIWTGSFDSDIFGTPLHVVAGGRSEEGLPFINRCQSILPLVAARDSLAWDLRPRPVAQTGWRILNLLTSVAVESAELEETIEETLVREWAPKTKHAARLIRVAMILSADHELNVSSFTARCVASAGSNPYAAVLGGLAAIEGVKHGGLSARVETLWHELRGARDLRRALGDRLRRGETIDGFGHRLYADGDPRANVLLEMLGEAFPKSKDLAFALSFAEAAESLIGERPTIDFALVAMCRTLRLPPGAPLALFALGRTIGWIGHAIEQYEEGAIIRPRAKYTGPAPE
ncbi:MAG TPA: citrate synthase family protein [Thermoanaerobaculia bacterium]|nr:citrate synthase family protein [Thermoanaerobaculia bacterium]